ncbi:hypothetical protein EK21DRAFT_86854 [Setomelanomma holmii]|uniref:Uncharacterized protein n=1 Tax=Setomelanomma holmii TaxID=210430 RepID=A0A9P4HFT8_9PLEO|nr:hypothetical protein EK21DRAFT_86854 [Setomelanomma holmii]
MSTENVGESSAAGAAAGANNAPTKKTPTKNTPKKTPTKNTPTKTAADAPINTFLFFGIKSKDFRYLSQFFESCFVENSITYLTAEHYFHMSKAKMFDRMEAFEQMGMTKEPADVERMGG